MPNFYMIMAQKKFFPGIFYCGPPFPTPTVSSVQLSTTWMTTLSFHHLGHFNCSFYLLTYSHLKGKTSFNQSIVLLTAMHHREKYVFHNQIKSPDFLQVFHNGGLPCNQASLNSENYLW